MGDATAARSNIDRNTLFSLLGLPKSAPARAEIATQRVTTKADYKCNTMVIRLGDRLIPATLLIPANPRGAVLYCHAHGNRPDIGRKELLDGRPALLSPPGPWLTKAGFAVLCLDMPGFGARQGEGREDSLAKALLWQGRTLMGEMLGDLRAGLDVIEDMKELSGLRVATMGISMGATHAYWLAALDDRVAGAAHLCAFANIKPLIASGAHDLHGLYMTVPGLLCRGDMEDVAALLAPRPQLMCAGGKDALTPAAALGPAIATLEQAYKAHHAEDALHVLVDLDAGHEESEKMRAATLAFLDRVFGD